MVIASLALMFLNIYSASNTRELMFQAKYASVQDKIQVVASSFETADTLSTETVDQVISEMFKGMGSMLPVAAVLLFGFTMGTMVKSLDTGNYLTSVFESLLTPALLPALTFLLCMLLSFATGTSMGTMAIMSVICLPMAINMGTNIPLVAGAIFGGSIFGDHCSPISDTTIMSCATSGCDIIDHVKTQMPYVLIMAAISLVLYGVLGFVM